MARPSPKGRAAGRAVKHIGFHAAAEKAAKGEGESLEAGERMVAAAAHKASKGAQKRNPNILKVRGVRKK